MPIDDPILAALAARTAKFPTGSAVLPPRVPNATLATAMDGSAGWVSGSPRDLWSISADGVQGWRRPVISGQVLPATPVAELPPPSSGLVTISVGTLLNLTAGMQSLQSQVEALRSKLNELIRARAGEDLEQVRIGLMMPPR